MIAWRVKQIEIAKAAPSYQAYLSAIPKTCRKKSDPTTPNARDAKLSKRQFQGKLKAWRQSIYDAYPQASVGAMERGEMDRQTMFFFLDPVEEVGLIQKYAHVDGVEVITESSVAGHRGNVGSAVTIDDDSWLYG